MTIKIFHNPRCSKSRQTLTILEDNGVDFDIIEYLKESPNKETLLQIINLLDIKPRDLMRKGEIVYKEKNLNRENLTDDDLLQFMVDNPILIERPIVYDDNRAIIGRPPENVLIFLKWIKKIIILIKDNKIKQPLNTIFKRHKCGLLKTQMMAI